MGDPPSPDDERARLLRAAASGEPLHGDVVVHLRPTGIMGTLAQMPLSEIIQMLDFGKKSGRVDVYLEGTQGSVHVHQGLIVRATATTASRTLFGEPAFLLLCRDNRGFFRIHYEREEVERNVLRPTTFVLLEALRTIDEASEGEATPPSSWLTDDDAAAEPQAEARPAEQLQQDPRYRCSLDVDVGGVAHVIRDIGLGGAFIATDAPREVGATIHLCVTERQGAAPLELLATVMHSRDAADATERGGVAGMGVRFDATVMSDEAQRRLRELVESVALQATALEATNAAPEEQAAAHEQAHGQAHEQLALPGSSMLDSIAEVDFLIATGDLKGAQAALLQANAASPNDDDVRRRLHNVNAQIEAALAAASLHHAERLIGKAEAIEHARRATKLRPSREVLLRALAVFAQARSYEDVAEAAAGLMNLDADDEGAIRTWLDANIELRRWTVALRTGEALLRRHPDDESLRKLVQRLAQRARASR